jgi:hypothetical protein
MIGSKTTNLGTTPGTNLGIILGTNLGPNPDVDSNAELNMPFGIKFCVGH